MIPLMQKIREAGSAFWLALKIFLRINGVHWAGAFAFSALLSLLPLVILCISISSVFIDQDQALRMIIGVLERYIPITGDMQESISAAISEVVAGSGQAGAIASLFLVWTALQCFITLICATNHAWGNVGQSWWKLPFKSLALLGITAFAAILGTGGPVVMQLFERLIVAESTIGSWLYSLASLLVPLLVTFIGLSLFYKMAPRETKRLSEVYFGALCTTVLLFVAKVLFTVYLNHVTTMHAIYGAFSGIIALLMWIYLSGCIFVFGACLCAALNQPPADAAANQKENMI